MSFTTISNDINGHAGVRKSTQDENLRFVVKVILILIKASKKNLEIVIKNITELKKLCTKGFKKLK